MEPYSQVALRLKHLSNLSLMSAIFPGLEDRCGAELALSRSSGEDPGQGLGENVMASVYEPVEAFLSMKHAVAFEIVGYD